ncbi:MAG: hypothetical protein LBC99_06310 [Spirochaetota bacterium]|jgi:hypothetical protein|nr:hypothetical protein [Spirochaetota bacterium]
MKKRFSAVSLIVVLMCVLCVSCGEEKSPYFNETTLAGTTWTHPGVIPMLILLNDDLQNYPAIWPCNIVFAANGAWSLELRAQAFNPSAPADLMTPVAGGTFELYGDGIFFTILQPEAAAGMEFPAGFSSATTLVVTEQVQGGEFTKVP